jgi:hypothetical protein
MDTSVSLQMLIFNGSRVDVFMEKVSQGTKEETAMTSVNPMQTIVMNID